MSKGRLKHDFRRPLFQAAQPPKIACSPSSDFQTTPPDKLDE
ncbi:hypothetical protein HMPREF3156_01060 [Neisseria sp. HMSC06F02]|nr:hypothetical protein HMPREF3156_01060 [Neisseria sp. HMSC06F02]